MQCVVYSLLLPPVLSLVSFTRKTRRASKGVVCSTHNLLLFNSLQSVHTYKLYLLLPKPKENYRRAEDISDFFNISLQTYFFLKNLCVDWDLDSNTRKKARDTLLYLSVNNFLTLSVSYFCGSLLSRDPCVELIPCLIASRETRISKHSGRCYWFEG